MKDMIARGDFGFWIEPIVYYLDLSAKYKFCTHRCNKLLNEYLNYLI